MARRKAGRERKLASPGTKNRLFAKYINDIKQNKENAKKAKQDAKNRSRDASSPKQSVVKPAINHQVKRLLRSSKRILNRSTDNQAELSRGQGIKRRLEFVKKKTLEEKSAAQELIVNVAKKTAEDIKNFKKSMAAILPKKTSPKKRTPKRKHKKLVPKPVNHTLEEGEIVSEMEVTVEANTTVVAAKSADDDDDIMDCVLIEPHVSCIVIDDDDTINVEEEPNRSNETLKPIQVGLLSTPNTSIKSPGKQAQNFQRPALKPTPTKPLQKGYSGANVTPKSQRPGLLPTPIAPLEPWNSLRKQAQKRSSATSTPLDKQSNIHDASLFGSFIEDFGLDGTGLLYTRRTPKSSPKSAKKCKIANQKTEATKKQSPIKPINNNTVILIEDSSMDESVVNSEMDTVIFVSETKSDTPPGTLTTVPATLPPVNKPVELPCFIPLGEADNACKPAKKKGSTISNGRKKLKATPPNKHKPNAFFTRSEQKQLEKYNDNTYNPNKEDSELNKSGKRFVIIDGSNVAFAHALSREFSVKGLQICIDYFKQRGHEVKAIIPLFRSHPHKCSDPDQLNKLYDQGYITWTPCKNLPSMRSTSYDDRFILQLACELDAAVVSNDNYRDLVNENTAFKRVIENRVIGYTWCNDVFLVPKDPYGRNGPTLDHILSVK